MNNEKILPFPPGGKMPSSTDIKPIKFINETSSLKAFFDTSPSIIERENKPVDQAELLTNAQCHGYQFVDISGSTAILDCHGHRYHIHTQALQIADFAIAVCRALMSEVQSNCARSDWMDARRRLQDQTNSIHSLGEFDNARGI